MSSLAWDQSFSVGHREIDRQHKRLLAFRNEMECLLLIPGGYNITARLNLVERLLVFVQKHFKLEREVMQEDGESDTAIYGHWRSYKNFDAKNYTFYGELLAKGLVLDSILLTIIRDEFHDHTIKGSKSVEFRKIKGIKPADVRWLRRSN